MMIEKVSNDNNQSDNKLKFVQVELKSTYFT